MTTDIAIRVSTLSKYQCYDAPRDRLKRMDLPSIVQKYQAEEILIAIPSANKGNLAKILQDCRGTGIPTQILSRTQKLASAASA